MELQSIIGGKKLSNLLSCLTAVKHLEGDIAELGVYKGGTALQMYETAPQKHLWLFDTFAGMPRSGPEDTHKVGDFADTDLESIRKAFADKPATLCVGTFPETTSQVTADKFCFIHLDADQYEVTKQGLFYFYHKLVVGGKFVLDDYEWSHCKGVKKAIDEFLAVHPMTFENTVKFQAVLTKS